MKPRSMGGRKMKRQKIRNHTYLRFIIFSLFLLVMGWTKVSAQNQAGLITVPNYPFTHFEKNKLTYPADSTCLYPLFRKFDNLFFKGQENINIVHIGGSHVQADIFSNRMRTNLLTTYPGIAAQRGIIFPYNAAKTNNPANYKVKYQGEFSVTKNVQLQPVKRLGLTGIAVTTSDSNAQIAINVPQQRKLDFSYTKVSILGYSDTGHVEPILIFRDSILYKTLYDTVANCYVFDLPDFADAFTIRFRSQDSIVWGNFTLTGIFLQNDLPGITYHAIGVNGASVPSYLKCSLLQPDVKMLKPDLFIFAIGINDASGDGFDTTVFIRNYQTLINRIQEAAPDCKFLFITNNDSYRRMRRSYKVNHNGLLARQAFYSLAQKYNGAVWDVFDIMGGLGSMLQWDKADLAQRDKVHFTSAGYSLLGDLLYNALMQEYYKYLAAQSK